MGKGQRHSKNAGVMGSESLTYAEKKALGFGTVQQRLGKESQNNYYDCCLTLQPAVDPVVTPNGYLYCKEAILENLLAQKKAIKRKLAAWEEQQRDQQLKAAEQTAISHEAKLIAFDRQNHMGMGEETAKQLQLAIEHEAAQMHEQQGAKGVVAIRDNQDRMDTMRAFWLPSKLPQTTPTALDKPDTDTYCPASGAKLRLKDLVAVHFTAVGEGESGRHMDPLTKDTLSNADRLVVLRPTGDVMVKETYTKCVKPEGSYNGIRIKEKDVIELQSGGTGFAAHDRDKVQTKKHFLLGPGSGKADLRGQHQGPRSLGGLVFSN